MSDRVLDIGDILNRLGDVFQRIDGDDLADIYNKYVDGPGITYEGDGLFVEGVK